MIVSSKPEEPRIGTRQLVEKQAEPGLAYLLSRVSHPDFPEPMGLFRCVEQPAYEDLLTQQVSDCIRTRGQGRLEDLFDDGETWVVS